MKQSILVVLALFSLFTGAQGQIKIIWQTDEPSPSPSTSHSPTDSASPTASPSNPPSLSKTPSVLPSVSVVPSMSPSHIPFILPSNEPTLIPAMPSDFPSLVPSTQEAIHDNKHESAMPSDFPSIVPSIYPTQGPTSVPSFSPSRQPSRSPGPSSTPSLGPSQQPTSSPTNFPSVVPTFEPSLRPSGTPSASPTQMPSETPTSVPSAVPTLAPSSVPSLLPSFQPTSEPSFSPSNKPSLSPSTSPSASPSTIPSSSPTAAPSASPTAPPTHHPTFGPTAIPTSIPTFEPTEQPSATPSTSPSTAPTETCHDVRTYRSPINNFTCADHIGTDCIQWRHLGLSVDQVESLIDNCPVSCGVECGTSLRFETVYSFKLWNIRTFLSPGAVSTMNDVAVEFLTNYVSNLEPLSRFFVYDTVLLSQQFAGNSPGRSLRSLQESSLNVDVEFRGYAIGLDQVTIDTRLRDGLFSPEFTLALQRSGDNTFQNTQVDKVGSHQPARASGEEPQRGASTGGISAAVIGSVAIVAAAGFYLFRSKRTSSKNRAFRRENQAVFDNFPTSPNQSVLSPASSFSFDATSNLVARMARIVNSFSPRSYDEETASKSVELSNSDSSESSKNIGNHVNVSVEEGMIKEEEDSGDEEEDDGVHPFTGIIPPMIVIDRIDSDVDIYVEDEQNSKKKVKTVVPTMRLEASSDLIAAINDRSKPFDPATFSSFILNNAPAGDEEGGSNVVEDLHIQGGGSSFNMFSSGDDEDDNGSKTSTAESADALFDRLRKAGSGDVDEGTSSTMARLDLRSRQPFGFPILTRPPRVPSEGSRNSPRSANTSPVISRDKSSTDGYNSDDTAAKERLSKRDAPSFLHSLWSKSPHNRNYPPGPKSDTSGESYNKRWGVTHKRSGSKGSYGTLGSLDDEGALLTFHAPKGKLGLVLECSTESAPIIAKVKDYSPLLDQVLPGDKIVMIDSTLTDKMGMPEVTSLLEGKSNRATSVRLRVFRPNDGLDGNLANQVRSPTVSHLSFDGTGSLGTMSDQESPVHFGHKMAATALSSLSMPSAKAGMKRSHSEAEINRSTE